MEIFKKEHLRCRAVVVGCSLEVFYKYGCTFSSSLVLLS